MIVLDASALVELILATDAGRRVAARIASPEIALHAPHLADIEIAHALRRLVQTGEIKAEEAVNALQALRDLDLERHAHEPLLDRIWQLRTHFTAYDAAYVALSEALGATLLTGDGKLARAPGAACPIEVVA